MINLLFGQSEWGKYKLRCMLTLRISDISKRTVIGYIFDVWQRHA